jgi:hypothetical protein
MRSARFERTINTRGEVVNQMVSVGPMQSTRAFTARDPADLAMLGYIQDGPRSRIYYGLDPAQLLDKTFLRTHCFSLAPLDPTRPAQVGLAFEPIREAAAPSDIKGTLWTQGWPFRLLELEFEFTGRGAVGRAGRTSGNVYFTEFHDRPIFVDRWSIHVRESAEREMGVLLLQADWKDGGTFKRPLPKVAGRVLDPHTHQPVSGVQVAARATPYTAVTGEDGAFEFAEVLPGTYTMIAYDSSLSRWGISPRRSVPLVRVDSTGTTQVNIALESGAALARLQCSGFKVGDGDGSVILRLLDSLGRQLASPLTVTVRQDAGGRPRETRRTVESGRAVLCGVNAGELSVHVEDQRLIRGAHAVMAAHGAAVDTLELKLRHGGGWSSGTLLSPPPKLAPSDGHDGRHDEERADGSRDGAARRGERDGPEEIGELGVGRHRYDAGESGQHYQKHGPRAVKRRVEAVGDGHERPA